VNTAWYFDTVKQLCGPHSQNVALGGAFLVQCALFHLCVRVFYKNGLMVTF
jgi:hypothetical protein